MTTHPGANESGRGFVLYDTHCHLHAECFDQDRDLVIDRARARGVVRVLAVAEDLEDAYRVLAVAERHRDFIVPALGVHPDRAPRVSDAEVTALMALVRQERGVLAAVGEVGLDHRPCWDTHARDRQAEIFRAMIALAREVELPLSVHSRGAGRHALEILRQCGRPPACLHAFDGRAVYAEAGARDGFFFSIPPSVARSASKRRMVPRLPLAALLLESDSPVLGPDPSCRNEPATLAGVLEEMARLRGEDAAELGRALEANTQRFLPRLAVTGARRQPFGGTGE